MDYTHVATALRPYQPRRLMRRNRAHFNHGFSMVEVLVSILVLTLGLLGMAGMQGAALHSNREARLQSAGVTFARELADQIRGNKVEGIKPTATNPYMVSTPTTAGNPLVAATPSYCLNVGTSSCTGTTDAANAELTEWLNRVDAELPTARVVVCYDSLPYDATTGLPNWACTAGAGAVIVIKIGWTRGSTNKANTGAAAFERASDASSVPNVVLPVTAGV